MRVGAEMCFQVDSLGRRLLKRGNFKVFWNLSNLNFDSHFRHEKQITDSRTSHHPT